MHVFKNYFSRTLDKKLVKEQERPEVAKLRKWGYLWGKYGKTAGKNVAVIGNNK